MRALLLIGCLTLTGCYLDEAHPENDRPHPREVLGAPPPFDLGPSCGVALVATLPTGDFERVSKVQLTTSGDAFYLSFTHRGPTDDTDALWITSSGPLTPRLDGFARGLVNPGYLAEPPGLSTQRFRPTLIEGPAGQLGACRETGPFRTGVRVFMPDGESIVDHELEDGPCSAVAAVGSRWVGVDSHWVPAGANAPYRLVVAEADGSIRSLPLPEARRAPSTVAAVAHAERAAVLLRTTQGLRVVSVDLDTETIVAERAFEVPGRPPYPGSRAINADLAARGDRLALAWVQRLSPRDDFLVDLTMVELDGDLEELDRRVLETTSDRVAQLDLEPFDGGWLLASRAPEQTPRLRLISDEGTVLSIDDPPRRGRYPIRMDVAVLDDVVAVAYGYGSLAEPETIAHHAWMARCRL